MNLHRYEAFYYVGEHRGISAAAHAMPWSIGVSAVSKQITALEEEFGGPLFVREPFRFLPLGQRLFEQIAPLYRSLLQVSREAAELTGPLLRICAADFVLREYLLPIVDQLRRAYPKMRVQLRSGSAEEMDAAMRREEIEVAIVLRDAPPDHFEWEPLLSFPLVLVVPHDHPAQCATDFWATRPVKHRLITPPQAEGVTRCFGRGLRDRGVLWPVTVESSSVAFVPALVESGGGVGVCAAARDLVGRHRLRVLPLEGFPPVTTGAQWRGNLTPELRAFLDLVTTAARQLEPTEKIAVKSGKGKAR